MCENSSLQSSTSDYKKYRRGKRGSKKKLPNLCENENLEPLCSQMNYFSINIEEISRPSCSEELVHRTSSTTDCTITKDDIPSICNEIQQFQLVCETLSKNALDIVSNNCVAYADMPQSNTDIVAKSEEQSILLKKEKKKKKKRKRKQENETTEDISTLCISDTKKEDIKLDAVPCISTKLSDSFQRGEDSKNIKTIIFTNSQYEKKIKKKKAKEKGIFPGYVKAEDIRKLLLYQQQDDIRYVEGNIRINPKFGKHAYVTMPDAGIDLLIIGLRDRNRALEGDLVVAMINSEEKWHKFDSGKVQKTGIVICILEEIHPRRTVGLLKPMSNKTNSPVLFHPRDPRFPLLRISSENFHADLSFYKNVLFLAELVNWNTVWCAEGTIQKKLGNLGELETERMAILLENDLDVAPYEEELTKELPLADYVLTPTDIGNREDWRDVCIFTIDPATAKDLDDAVSCIKLDNGNYEIGVHIADVTHYLEAFSPLDEEVSKRATTIYLVDTVHHMLPKQLCEVCSLTPGQDKLAFSVILEMTPTAHVVKSRFAKTVINSCYQMAYEEAQMMIENPLKDWTTDVSMNIKGKYKPSDLCRTVNELYKLSALMRDARFSNGALKIDQPKLYIILDEVSKLPISYKLEEQKESNRLIEEFMLLANMTVATHLYDVLPETALLRKHREPLKHILIDVQNMFEIFGVHLNIDSAANLQASLRKYQPSPMPHSEEYQCLEYYRMMVINAHCARAMIRANYICSSSISEDDLKHYALNVPLYTHFTSPIRRYPDCVVHRLLYSSIRKTPLPPKWTPSLCSKIASNCNKKKYNAKIVQEKSNELYFTHLLELMGPLNTTAIVMDIKDRSIDVILCQVGFKLRLYLFDIEKDATIQYSMNHFVPVITILWNAPAVNQVINIFSILHVRVDKHPTTSRLYGILQPPKLVDL